MATLVSQEAARKLRRLDDRFKSGAMHRDTFDHELMARTSYANDIVKRNLQRARELVRSEEKRLLEYLTQRRETARKRRQLQYCFVRGRRVRCDESDPNRRRLMAGHRSFEAGLAAQLKGIVARHQSNALKKRKLLAMEIGFSSAQRELAENLVTKASRKLLAEDASADKLKQNETQRKLMRENVMKAARSAMKAMGSPYQRRLDRELQGRKLFNKDWDEATCPLETELFGEIEECDPRGGDCKKKLFDTADCSSIPSTIPDAWVAIESEDFSNKFECITKWHPLADPWVNACIHEKDGADASCGCLEFVFDKETGNVYSQQLDGPSLPAGLDVNTCREKLCDVFAAGEKARQEAIPDCKCSTCSQFTARFDFAQFGGPQVKCANWGFASADAFVSQSRVDECNCPYVNAGGRWKVDDAVISAGQAAEKEAEYGRAWSCREMVHRAYHLETWGAGMRDDPTKVEPNPHARMGLCYEAMTGRHRWDGQLTPVCRKGGQYNFDGVSVDQCGEMLCEKLLQNVIIERCFESDSYGIPMLESQVEISSMCCASDSSDANNDKIEEFCNAHEPELGTTLKAAIARKCTIVMSAGGFKCPDFRQAFWIPIEENHHMGGKQTRWEQCHDCGARMFKQAMTTQMYNEVGYNADGTQYSGGYGSGDDCGGAGDMGSGGMGSMHPPMEGSGEPGSMPPPMAGSGEPGSDVGSMMRRMQSGSMDSSMMGSMSPDEGMGGCHGDGYGCEPATDPHCVDGGMGSMHGSGEPGM
jgi:hypothetical protein